MSACTTGLAAMLLAAPLATHGLEVRPAGDGIHVHVGKRGLFAAFAHDHDFEVTSWRGTAEIPDGDPARARLELVLDASSLHDREGGLSASDRRKVDAQAAGPGVLDAAGHPEITFRSERIGLQGGGGRGAARGTIHGALTLRGRTRPVDASFEAERDGDAWHVRGSARFRQSDFGIEPFRGVGGTVGVKDEVEVTFAVTIQPGAGGASAAGPPPP